MKMSRLIQIEKKHHKDNKLSRLLAVILDARVSGTVSKF